METEGEEMTREMEFIGEDVLPRAEELKRDLPLEDSLKEIKAQRDREIADVFNYDSDKFLLVIGPCAADHPEPVVEYCRRLVPMQEKFKKELILIPRVYTNKPRTNGKGYKGLAYQSDLKGSPDLLEGLRAMRDIHLQVLQETGLTTADEMLTPSFHPYLDDILSYVAVGARSVENQEHRIMSSAVKVPVGMKNSTSGNLTVMMNSIDAGRARHELFYDRRPGLSPGNPHTHAILRGFENEYGRKFPNYHFEDIRRVLDLYEKKKIAHPFIVIDTNHDNSGKRFSEQPRIASEVMHYRKISPCIRDSVIGMMIESYLIEGTQKVASDGSYRKGQSIMDPCLGWNDTEKLINKIGYHVREINKTR